MIFSLTLLVTNQYPQNWNKSLFNNSQFSTSWGWNIAYFLFLGHQIFQSFLINFFLLCGHEICKSLLTKLFHFADMNFALHFHVMEIKIVRFPIKYFLLCGYGICESFLINLFHFWGMVFCFIQKLYIPEENNITLNKIVTVF